MAKLTAQKVLETLQEIYDPPKTFLPFRTPLDLTVATILSAQCTDARVNEVTKNILYPKYKTPKDYLAVTRTELESDIHSCGTYRNKAKYIQELCQILLDKYAGKVPSTLDQLVQLPGVGRKTAAIIAYAGFGNLEAIAVDTHVIRLSRRLGLSKHHNPDKISLDLMEQTPKKHWGDITTLIISHGRAVCTAWKRNCKECVFKDECPSSLTEGKSDLSKL